MSEYPKGAKPPTQDQRDRLRHLAELGNAPFLVAKARVGKYRSLANRGWVTVTALPGERWHDHQYRQVWDIRITAAGIREALIK